MIRTFAKRAPKIHKTAFVHDAAEVIGAVELGPRASVWPMCVLRGDIERIVIGAGSNVQDLCVIHTRKGRPTLLGREVTVGHNAVLHGAKIGDGALIGMGAVVMEAEIGKGALVAAGALVPPGMRVPPGMVAMGAPAKVVRKVSSAERREMRRGTRAYRANILRHRKTSRIVFPS